MSLVIDDMRRFVNQLIGYDIVSFAGNYNLRSHLSRIFDVYKIDKIIDVGANEGMPNYMKSLSTFEAAGFSVSGFYPITRNKILSLNEVDCVLVNTSKLITISK